MAVGRSVFLAAGAIGDETEVREEGNHPAIVAAISTSVARLLTFAGAHGHPRGPLIAEAAPVTRASDVTPYSISCSNTIGSSVPASRLRTIRRGESRREPM